MRILHLNNEKTWRGGERQTLLTASEQLRMGLEPRIACRRGSPLESAARSEGVPVLFLPNNAPGALLVLAREARSSDVVHCHTGRTHSLAVIAMWSRRRPLVVSRRVDFLPARAWFNRFKYGRADEIVCVSRSIARQLQDWGVPQQRLKVIYEAVPDVTWRSREDCLKELRTVVPVPAGKRVIGNIAALVPHKDHATLLRAARAAVDQRDDLAFVIIGEGPLRDDLLRLRAQLGLEAHVFLAGFIPQAQQLLPAFDVFAMSSCMEGLGTIVLDANLAGIPVVATAGGGLPETVNDHQTGLLVPVGDAPALASAILKLLSDEPLAARLAAAARQRTRTEFAPAVMARKYVDVYQSLLAK
jgi:glycosyltransferase involved in cell wall biosynthesis